MQEVVPIVDGEVAVVSITQMYQHPSLPHPFVTDHLLFMTADHVIPEDGITVDPLLFVVSETQIERLGLLERDLLVTHQMIDDQNQHIQTKSTELDGGHTPSLRLYSPSP